MALPSDLIPHPVDPDRIARAASLIARLEQACDDGLKQVPALDELRDMTGNAAIQTDDYHEISGAMSYEDAAKMAFCPVPRPISDLEFTDFVALCQYMMDNVASGTFDYWYRLYCLNARRPHAGDLVFHPPQIWVDHLIKQGEVPTGTTALSFEPTARQIATEAWRNDAVTGESVSS